MQFEWRFARHPNRPIVPTLAERRIGCVCFFFCSNSNLWNASDEFFYQVFRMRNGQGRRDFRCRSHPLERERERKRENERKRWSNSHWITRPLALSARFVFVFVFCRFRCSFGPSFCRRRRRREGVGLFRNPILSRLARNKKAHRKKLRMKIAHLSIVGHFSANRPPPDGPPPLLVFFFLSRQKKRGEGQGEEKELFSLVPYPLIDPINHNNNYRGYNTGVGLAGQQQQWGPILWIRQIRKRRPSSNRGEYLAAFLFFSSARSTNRRVCVSVCVCVCVCVCLFVWFSIAEVMPPVHLVFLTFPLSLSLSWLSIQRELFFRIVHWRFRQLKMKTNKQHKTTTLLYLSLSLSFSAPPLCLPPAPFDSC